MGVVVVGYTSRNNYDPHPARLRFASAVDPPHKGGRVGARCFVIPPHAIHQCCAGPRTEVSGSAVLPLFTMSNSPVSDVPGTHSLILSNRNSCRTAALSAPAALAAPRVYSFILLPPPRGDGGAPTGASLEHVALVGRDATLARRGPSRATGRPPLGAPPWRCRPRVRFRRRRCRRLRCEGSTPPGDPARPRPRASRVRGYEPRSTPHPAPPSGSSPETPLIERDV